MEIMDQCSVSSLKSHAQNKPRALVVDDSNAVRQSLSFVLKIRGIQSVPTGNAAEAMNRFLAENFDLVFTDLDMPDTHGLELIKWIRMRKPLIPVVIVSANTTSGTRSAAALPGVEFVQKPFSLADIDAVLAPILRNFQSQPKSRSTE